MSEMRFSIFIRHHTGPHIYPDDVVDPQPSLPDESPIIHLGVVIYDTQTKTARYEPTPKETPERTR